MALAALAACMMLSAADFAPAAWPIVREGEEFPPKESLEASILRGDIAFQSYCALCHGAQADGRGRAARLYTPRPANLRASRKSDAYKEAIIRKGGRAMARSQFMPPWGDELTDEQVTDLVHYLRSVAPLDAPQ